MSFGSIISNRKCVPYYVLFWLILRTKISHYCDCFCLIWNKSTTLILLFQTSACNGCVNKAILLAGFGLPLLRMKARLPAFIRRHEPLHALFTDEVSIKGRTKQEVSSTYFVLCFASFGEQGKCIIKLLALPYKHLLRMTACSVFWLYEVRHVVVSTKYGLYFVWKHDPSWLAQARSKPKQAQPLLRVQNMKISL